MQALGAEHTLLSSRPDLADLACVCVCVCVCVYTQALGAEHTLLSSRPDLAEEILRLTGGQGVHVVYDGVGKATWELSKGVLRLLGLLVSFGNASGKVGPKGLHFTPTHFQQQLKRQGTFRVGSKEATRRRTQHPNARVYQGTSLCANRHRGRCASVVVMSPTPPLVLHALAPIPCMQLRSECTRHLTVMHAFDHCVQVPPIELASITPKNIRVMRPSLFEFVAGRPTAFSELAQETFTLVTSGKLKVGILGLRYASTLFYAASQTYMYRHRETERRGTRDTMCVCVYVCVCAAQCSKGIQAGRGSGGSQVHRRQEHYRQTAA